MITYNRYLNREDHVWYDSSNIIYSKCYDTQNSKSKTLKIVFKGGRTYLYKNVDSDDYLMFKNAQSNGVSFNEHIKKYDSVRIMDTDMDKLSNLMESFKNEVKENEEQKLGDLVYNIDFTEATGDFCIKLGNQLLFNGKDNGFSIFDLFASLNIKYQLNRVEEIVNDSDEDLKEIRIN